MELKCKLCCYKSIAGGERYEAVFSFDSATVQFECFNVLVREGSQVGVPIALVHYLTAGFTRRYLPNCLPERSSLSRLSNFLFQF